MHNIHAGKIDGNSIGVSSIDASLIRDNITIDCGINADQAAAVSKEISRLIAKQIRDGEE